MQTFTTSDGLNIAYSDTGGTGKPLLCLSGLTRNSSDFRHITPYAADMRLIKMDYRGRGESEFTHDWESYSIPREAMDAVELLDHLGLDRTAILGTSRGGLIAMLLAATAKYRLTGVMLNDIGPELASQGLDAIMGFLGLPPKWLTYEQAAAALPDVSVGFANVPASRWLDEAQHRWIEKPNGLHLRYDPKLRNAVEAATHQAVPDMWEIFDCLSGLPLALVRGENSDLLTMDTVREMQIRHPDMIFANAADRGHIPFLDEPESLIVLNQFKEALP